MKEKIMALLLRAIGGILVGIIGGTFGFGIITEGMGFSACPYGLIALITGATISAVVGFVLVEKFTR